MVTNSFNHVRKSSFNLDLLTFRCLFWNLDKICIGKHADRVRYKLVGKTDGVDRNWI